MALPDGKQHYKIKKGFIEITDACNGTMYVG